MLAFGEEATVREQRESTNDSNGTNFSAKAGRSRVKVVTLGPTWAPHDLRSAPLRSISLALRRLPLPKCLDLHSAPLPFLLHEPCSILEFAAFKQLL